MDAREGDVSYPWDPYEEYADAEYWYGPEHSPGPARAHEWEEQGRAWGPGVALRRESGRIRRAQERHEQPRFAEDYDPGERGAGSTRIQLEIDRTRSDMDRTVAELRERLSPRHLIDRVMDSITGGGGTRGAGQSFSAAGREIADTVRENPVPLALIGAGLAWLAIERTTGGGRTGGAVRGRRDRVVRGGYGDEDWLAPGAEYIPGSAERGSGRRMMQRAGEAAGAAAETVRDRAESIAGNVGGAARSAGDAIGRRAWGVQRGMGGVGGTLQARASHLGERVSERATEVQRGFWEKYDEYPLPIGAAALALGVLGGLLVPTTRAEDRLMGEASDEVARRAKEAGRTVLESGKEVARHVAEAANQGASRAGDLAGKVREAASRGVEAAVDETRRQGQRLRDEIPGQMPGREGQ